MNERRKHKNAEDEQGKMQYKRFKNNIQKRCKKVRNKWIEGKCNGAETLLRIGNVDAIHREVKGNFGKRRVNANIVRNKNGKASTKSREEAYRWVEYIESLYKDDALRGQTWVKGYFHI